MYNQQTDLYGGCVENRVRMLLETYCAIRCAVGTDFQIWVKINSSDGIEGGQSFEDSLYACKQLSNLGVDAIEVSGNWYANSLKKDIYYKEEASKIADECNASVIVTGGNRNYLQINQFLNSSKIEYIGMASLLLRNPIL